MLHTVFYCHLAAVPVTISPRRLSSRYCSKLPMVNKLCTCPVVRHVTVLLYLYTELVRIKDKAKGRSIKLTKW